MVSLQLVLAILLPAIERLLEQCAPDTLVFLPDEALLLQLLLGKYSEASAPLLARDARSLELFISALGSSSKPYSHMDSFQIIAMEQVGSRTLLAQGCPVLSGKGRYGWRFSLKPSRSHVG